MRFLWVSGNVHLENYGLWDKDDVLLEVHMEQVGLVGAMLLAAGFWWRVVF